MFSQGPEEPQEAESDQYTKDQTTSKSAKVGQVMTEEEYEEWRKEREGGKPDEQDAGIDWGMGEIWHWYELCILCIGIWVHYCTCDIHIALLSLRIKIM